MESSTGATTYRNPIIDADLPDPDAIRVGDRFYLIASSFHRSPGLPVFASDDLVTWTRVSFALPSPTPADWFALPRHGGGVWAPSIRHHDGLFHIVYPDPDRGIFVVTAEDAAGPWSEPHLLLPGLGLIDPCPLWDEDGRTYLVHGWAASRAGRKNTLTVVPVDAALRRPTGTAVDVIHGDALPGFTTLEGPKFYRRDGWYWIFAPAGGVSTGWQTVFRADNPYGPYEHRIVLAQGDTPVNGPHQGAWVDDGTGRDWFLHFQDRGPFGRVLHLQPMAWDDDGWPLMGEAAHGSHPTGAPAQPVIEHPLPFPDRTDAPPYRTLARSDDFADGRPSDDWQWEASIEQATERADTGILTLRSNPDGDNVRTMPRVLSQPLPGGPCAVGVDVELRTTDAADLPIGPARAGLAVLGRDYVWAGIRRGADRADATAQAVVAVRRAGDLAEHVIATAPLPHPRARVRFDIDADAGVRIAIDRVVSTESADDVRSVDPAQHTDPATTPTATPVLTVDPAFTATSGQWVGASLSLFAASPYGDPESTGVFRDFRVELRGW